MSPVTPHPPLPTRTDGSLREALAHGRTTLATAGIEAARHDVEELAAHALGCERGQLWRYLEDGLVPEGATLKTLKTKAA